MEKINKWNKEIKKYFKVLNYLLRSFGVFSFKLIDTKQKPCYPTTKSSMKKRSSLYSTCGSIRFLGDDFWDKWISLGQLLNRQFQLGNVAFSPNFTCSLNMLKGHLPLQAPLSRVQLWILQFSTRETIAETFNSWLNKDQKGNVQVM